MPEFQRPLKTREDLYKALDHVEDWYWARKLNFMIFIVVLFISMFYTMIKMAEKHHETHPPVNLSADKVSTLKN